jgi:hypothetical protein
MSRATRQSNLKLTAFLLFAFALIVGGFYLTRGLYSPFVVPGQYKDSSVVLLTRDSISPEQLPEQQLTPLYIANGYRTSRFVLLNDQSYQAPELWLRQNGANKIFLWIHDSRTPANAGNDSADQSLSKFLGRLNGIHSLEKSLIVVTSDDKKGSSQRVPIYIKTPDGRDISMKEVNRADLPPTILELTGLHIPASMTGKSLIPQINARE